MILHAKKDTVSTIKQKRQLKKIPERALCDCINGSELLLPQVRDRSSSFKKSSFMVDLCIKDYEMY